MTHLRPLTLLLGALLALTGLGLGAVELAAAAPGVPQRDAPAPKTIVDITGDATDGFHVDFYDGSHLFPPTDSEAAAECGEYGDRLSRVRCRVHVRTWYRDLGATQAALDHAHSA